MDLQIEQKKTHQINRTPVLQQTAFWSEIKEKQGVESTAFDLKVKFSSSIHEKYIQDDLLVLVQQIGNNAKIAYVPYGPTLEPDEENQGKFLEELSESIRPFLGSDCVTLRYDLLWESLWAKDPERFREDNWIGPPEKQNQEIRLNFTTQKGNLRKANTNILPKDTLFIDLTKNEDFLLMQMKSKTRYNIKLAKRKGVSVRVGDRSDIQIWYDLYKETCNRNGIFLHPIENFKMVLNTSAYHTNSPAEVELLIAEHENTPLAAVFIVYSARRATYLYGASSTFKRNYMATYRLQWEAILRAKKRGCTEYDMFGIAPYKDPSHPMYGLYRFKTGFGGNIFHRMGCWDYPLDTENYDLFQTIEMKSQGYHIN